jgi:TPR repeat protein
MRTGKWIATVLVACGALSTLGQAPQSSAGSIDSALLAKANSGDVASEIAVGDCYTSGNRVPRDYKQAAGWYLKAAEKGDVAAEMRLASLYRDGGKDFPRDMAQAAEWYRKAGDQGDATAQGTLGTLYFMGQGVEQNYLEAYFWLDLAAGAKGPKQAQYAANRQLVGTHITADELEGAKERITAWKVAHARPTTAQ